MESRKRSRTEEGDPVRVKRRVMSDERDTPQPANGVGSDTDEPKDGDNLEMFRKDAIFRRMKHYSREHERSQAKIAELERRRSTCEAGLAALEACWSQLITTVRSLAKPEELPSVPVDTQDIFDLSSCLSSDSDPTYVNNLRGKFNVTQQLVSAFFQLGGKNHTLSPKDEIFRKCQKAQTEYSSLRAEYSLMNAKLRDAEAEKEKLHEQLVVAEKRIDRLQSKTVIAFQRRSSPQVKEFIKDESPQESPASPAPPQIITNGIHPPLTDESEWKSIAEVKERQIGELSRELLSAREEISVLKTQLTIPSDEVIENSPNYKSLSQHSAIMENLIYQLQDDLQATRTELQQLHSARHEWQEEQTNASEKISQDLRSQLTKRDQENTRLREQRDQQFFELNERKQKEHVKFTSLVELKALSESRAERIKALESEVNRLKGRLAAESAGEDLLEYLSRNSSEELSYVDDLKKRLSDAETRASAVESSLSFFQEDHPDIVQHMRAESEAKQQLSKLRKKLDQYESLFGSASPDVQLLTERLSQKEADIKRLLLKEKQREQAESSLYAELDKLSAAWEALDRQVKSKVFDLTALEEKLTKSGLDKAKSENKFYAAMRDKEAVENERKNLTRNLEKQAKLVERLVEVEKSLTSRVNDLEKEVALCRKYSDQQKEKIHALQGESSEWRARAEGERKRAEDMRVAILDQEKQLDQKRTELRKSEDSMVKAKKEAEKQSAKLKASSFSHPIGQNGRESELQSELDKCMKLLQCSTCQMNMRTTVITKCMHSFCKQCVDNRIQSRQRKCPACGLAFSQGEVQQLFFQ